ncbi:hypothetical protein [Clostridium sp. UBA4395]
MGSDAVIKHLSTLNEYEQQKVFNFLEEMLITSSLSNEIKEDVKENRFSS